MTRLVYESVIGNPVIIRNPTKLKVKDLFAYSADTGSEYERTYYKPVRLVPLENIDTFIAPAGNDYWIRFSVSRHDLKSLKLTRPKFLEIITYRTASVFRFNQIKITYGLLNSKSRRKYPKRREAGFLDLSKMR